MPASAARDKRKRAIGSGRRFTGYREVFRVGVLHACLVEICNSPGLSESVPALDAHAQRFELGESAPARSVITARVGGGTWIL